MHHLTYPEAIVVGLFQGVTELFPVSSLGHSVLIPALIGGSWDRDLNVSTPESPYLAFIVGLHVATAIALLIFFRRDWARIVVGFLSSIRDRRLDNPDGWPGSSSSPPSRSDCPDWLWSTCSAPLWASPYRRPSSSSSTG